MTTDNYASIVNNRKIICGEPSELMAISPLKHTWAMDSFLEMCSNDWRPQTIEMQPDVLCYRDELSDAERFTYNKCLAFLSNLDGIQLHNITDNISKYVTSPEVKMAFTRQAFDESLHVLSYSYMAEAVSGNPMEIYMTFQKDGALAKKNEVILKQSRILGENFSPRTFILTTVSNVALEGIFFYTGFLYMYNFARYRKMMKSSEMISYINRDEDCHLRFFLKLWNGLKLEHPSEFNSKLIDDARELLYTSSELEKNWGRYIIQHGVPGTNNKSNDLYIEYICDLRCASLGIPAIYNTAKEDPCPWVHQFSSINNNERNFFETKNISYQVGTLEW